MRTPLSRRRFLSAAGAAAGLWVSGCGTARPGAGGPITLRLIATGDPAMLASVVPQFEQANPGVQVHYSLAQTGNAQALATALLTGSGPDVFWDNDPSRYLGTPLVLDLAARVAQAGVDLGDFGTGVLAGYRSGSGLFMLPRTVAPAAYAVRTDVLTSAGVAVPDPSWTYSDLAALWRRIGDSGLAVGGRLDWAPTSTYYLNGWGAHLVQPSKRETCALDAPAAIACGQWMSDRFAEGASAAGPDGQNAGADFQKGSLAMEIVDAAGIAGFAGTAAALPWRLLPFPRWPSGPATAANADFYAVSAASRHPDAAVALLAFLTGPQCQRAAIGSGLVPPSRRSLWAEYLAALAAAAPPLAHQPLDALSGSVEQDWALAPEQFRFQPQALTVLLPYWQRIFGPGASLNVSQGFVQATAAVNAIEQSAARAGGNVLPFS